MAGTGKGYGSPMGRGMGRGEFSVSKNPKAAPRKGSSLRTGAFASEGNKVNAMRMKQQATKENSRGHL